MQKNLFLGVEAIGQGAIDGGISGVYAYPGTPSTEITEFIQENELAQEKGIRSKWSANEKNGLRSRFGYVVRRKTQHGLYEACGFERGCRCFY